MIEAAILTDSLKREDVFYIPSDIPFERLQYPVQQTFAMTIHKAQRQSLKVVGINLESPWLFHEKLYFSRSKMGTLKHLCFCS